MAVRILLADDHNILRSGLRALLEGIAGLEVVGEARDGREALALVKAHRPDVLLTDIAMPGLNGLEATVRVTKDFPHTRVLILSMHPNEEYVCQALRAGAAGYLLKDASIGELEQAIQAVSRGETYLAQTVSKHAIDRYMKRLDGDASPVEILTPRQREILQLIAEGNSTKEVARILHISVKTAETHRTQLMERLDLHDVASLVRYAVRVGMIHPNQ